MSSIFDTDLNRFAFDSTFNCFVGGLEEKSKINVDILETFSCLEINGTTSSSTVEFGLSTNRAIVDGIRIAELGDTANISMKVGEMAGVNVAKMEMP